MKSSHGSDGNTIDGVPRRRIVLASMVGGTLKRLGLLVRLLGLLGKRWKTLHKIVYLVLGLGLLHFLWVVRADLEQWSLYAAVGALLMILRIPPIARQLPKFRQLIKRPGRASV